MRRGVAMVFVGLMVATGACGDDDDDEARARAEVEAKTEATAAVDGELAAFCSARVDAEKAAPTASTPTTALTKEALREQFAKAKEGLDEMVEHAPAEIEADVRVFADAQKATFDAFQKANFDFSKVDFNNPAFKRLSSPEVQAASKRLTDFFAAKCGKPAG